jgi:hypothetical protein
MRRRLALRIRRVLLEREPFPTYQEKGVADHPATPLRLTQFLKVENPLQSHSFDSFSFRIVSFSCSASDAFGANLR